ncbi:metallophosphoesterase [Pirellulaceae bacterium SH501]
MRLTRRSLLEKSASIATLLTIPSYRLATGKNADDPKLHLGIVADPQYADVPTLGTRYYRKSIRKLTEAVEHFNEQRVDLSINLGDLIDRNWNSFDAMTDVLSKSKSPFYHVLGNHDFDVLEEEKRKVADRIGIASRYYRVLAPGWRFLFLDTNDLSLYATEKENDGYREADAMLQEFRSRKLPQAQTWNGALGKSQLNWIRSECLEAAKLGERVILFAHHPIYPDNNHNLWNAEELKTLIAEHRVIAAWMNGHNHAGNFGVFEDVPMITFKGMVETESTNAYSLLTLEKEGLEIHGIGREPSRKLAFRKV